MKYFCLIVPEEGENCLLLIKVYKNCFYPD